MGRYDDLARGQGEGATEVVNTSCASIGCHLRGSISMGGERWHCFWHAGAAQDQEAVITNAMNRHSSLLAEIIRGELFITSPISHRDADIKAFAEAQAERLIPIGYVPRLDLLEPAEFKAWPSDYRAFVAELRKSFQQIIREAVAADAMSREGR